MYKDWDGKYQYSAEEIELRSNLIKWRDEVLQVKTNIVPDDGQGTSIFCKCGIHNYMHVPFKSMDSCDLRRDAAGYVASYYVCCRKNCHKVKTDRHETNEMYF